jgi:uncharacterized protein YwgA
MSDLQRWRLRLGVITELVARAPCKLGRTAIMKLTYLLQTVKGVPLGYDFRLHTYGPFESDVLNDLGLAESLGAVRSEMITFPSGAGYGYEFTAGPGRIPVQEMASQELAEYQDSIRWSLEEFGQRPAADLELISTIVYADQESFQRGQRISVEELRHKVKGIKPHFTEGYIEEHIRGLAAKGLLVATDVSQ